MPTPLVQDLPFPPHWINLYLFNKLGEYGPDQVGVSPNQTLVPFFATNPTGIEEVYANLVAKTDIVQPLMVQFDRLMRFRTNPLYAIKKEQLVFYLYGKLPYVQNANTVISQLLDREDASAQDLNDWTRDNPIIRDGDIVPCNVFFHNIRVYQIDESRDLVALSSSNLSGTVGKLIIEYDYHVNWDTSAGDMKQQEQFR